MKDKIFPNDFKVKNRERFFLKIKILLFFLLSFTLNKGFSQNYEDYIDPKWDTYYKNRPSGIETKFNSADFISVTESVNFIPVKRLNSLIKGDMTLFRKVLLNLDLESLEQMSITGNFYSRSKKHDDFFYLYNSNYKQISKENWDRYCPYLIPLMELDGTVLLQ
jgi:hypothetical protein